jgi:hypothetical protein
MLVVVARLAPAGVVAILLAAARVAPGRLQWPRGLVQIQTSS